MDEEKLKKEITDDIMKLLDQKEEKKKILNIKNSKVHPDISSIALIIVCFIYFGIPIILFGMFCIQLCYLYFTDIE